jgi:hypothetical protein
MTSTLQDELWKRVMSSEDEFHKVLDDVLKNYISLKKDKGSKDDKRHTLLGIVDRIEEYRGHMIKATNMWREFKWMEEEKNE